MHARTHACVRARARCTAQHSTQSTHAHRPARHHPHPLLRRKKKRTSKKKSAPKKKTRNSAAVRARPSLYCRAAASLASPSHTCATKINLHSLKKERGTLVVLAQNQNPHTEKKRLCTFLAALACARARLLFYLAPPPLPPPYSVVRDVAPGAAFVALCRRHACARAGACVATSVSPHPPANQKKSTPTGFRSPPSLKAHSWHTPPFSLPATLFRAAAARESSTPQKPSPTPHTRPSCGRAE